MKKIGLHEIRREFLEFFDEKEHLVAPSFSLVPEDDDSLLLVGAGMAPLKKYFTGEAKPPKTRMATCQRCIRTGDIENVGKTDRHATFFEMLGNFSFGDYFKIESMEWAWEFLTERMGIDGEDIWVTVYKEDDEAFELWRDELDIPEEKIIRLGKEDNFWELEVGPSGPCSEIFVDRGEKYGCGDKDCKPGCECDRFIEVWNLVFTQYDKDSNGEYHRLSHPNIDTGMGLERLAAVLEGADNIFEIEAIQDIIKAIEGISGHSYGTDSKKDESIRVITDHARAMVFLVSDGVVPGNEGRDYVLRRLIRRAARHGKLLGIERAFLSELADAIIDSWKVEYTEIDKNRERIKKVIAVEEARFQETIDAGIERLNRYVDQLKKENKGILAGEDVFKLYDTYGFPVDLTREILQEEGLAIDEAGFEENMQAQRERARQARKSDNVGWSSGDNKKLYEAYKTEFLGYELTKSQANIMAIIKEAEEVKSLAQGEKAVIILDKTPFYGESGGQIGDTGYISSKSAKAKVVDTQRVSNDTIIHLVEVEEGIFNLEDSVKAEISCARRDEIKRNHSATHLLYQALKEKLGDHVEQAGSLVLDDRLRFDFTHYEALKLEELKEIEARVNEIIQEAIDLEVKHTSLEKAQAEGIVGLFADKYEDEVRVIGVGDFSRELCGGTHVNNTAEIGLFKIISESGIASGVRRIEAIVGKEVYKHILGLENELDEIARLVKANRDNLNNRVGSLVEELKSKDKEIEGLRKELASDLSEDLLEEVKEEAGIKYIAHSLDNMDMDSMRNLADELRTKLDSGVVVLASILDGKLTFLTMISQDLVKRGLKAGDIVREVAKVTDGNGGGRPDMAQAGGKDLTKLNEALELVPRLISENLK